MADTTPPFPLSQLRRWCRWDLRTSGSGKPTKRPDQSTAELEHCRTWEDVAAAERTPQGGVGVVVTGGIQEGGLHYIPLDLDECVNGPTLAPWAAEVLAAYPSYTELSPSLRGLRLWLAVQERPTLAKSLVRFDAAPGATKVPQLQVFGASRAAGYVTFTGMRYGAHSEIARFASLRWLMDRFGLGEKVAVAPIETTGATSLDAIDAKIRAHHHGRFLVDGLWQAVVAGGSASEAYHLLASLVLQVTGNNAAAAVDYLLQRTVWGQGEVEGSIDPGKYAKRTWVERDVARAVGKAPASAPAAFSVEAGRLVGSIEFLRRRAGQRFLVDGLLPRTGLAQVFGDPGCGKTPFAMSIALHVAARRPTWFGKDVERTGPVVYLVGEDASGLGWRLEAEMQALGVEKEEIDGTLLWSTQPGRLGDSADVALWESEIRALAPAGPALIVVDTQSRNFGDGDENSTQDMTRFVTNLANLAERLGCLILLVHHTGHTAKERARGSSVLYGAVDALFRVTREGSRVTATAEKCKNWSSPEPLEGILVPRTLGLDSRGRPITAITLRPAEDRMFGEDRTAEVLSALDADRNLNTVVNALRGEPNSAAATAKRSGFTLTRTRVLLNRLHDLDIVIARREGRETIYELDAAALERVDAVRRAIDEF